VQYDFDAMRLPSLIVPCLKIQGGRATASLDGLDRKGLATKGHGSAVNERIKFLSDLNMQTNTAKMSIK